MRCLNVAPEPAHPAVHVSNINAVNLSVIALRRQMPANVRLA